MPRLDEHFTNLSRSYNDLRTTDPEPVRYIQGKLRDRKKICGADIGCGGGRYDLLLLERVPGLSLICADVNEAILEETARFLESHGHKNIHTRKMDASAMPFPQNSLDFAMTFNAIHHFDPVVFLQQVSRSVKDSGYVFVYTRLRSQNARNVWGRFFPGFNEKEGRLFQMSHFEAWMNRVEELSLIEIVFFKFRRVVSLDHLMNQARNKHYSTFSLYGDREFTEALMLFREKLQQNFHDLQHIEWIDENIMLTFTKDCSS
ncbi:MAG: class I SAM-dependent methyltransferase [bacterium]|nr:class I SAM-dependent methyltransferase [bacterium]